MVLVSSGAEGRADSGSRNPIFNAKGWLKPPEKGNKGKEFANCKIFYFEDFEYTQFFAV